MPKSICEGTWGVCARVNVCVPYACVFGIALLPLGHTGGETRKSTRASLSSLSTFAYSVGHF